MQPIFTKFAKCLILFDKSFCLVNHSCIRWVTKQPITKRFDMTQTPKYVFNKNTFAWAVDTAWDFKKYLFDYVAGINSQVDCAENFAELENFISDANKSKKKKDEKDSAYLYLANTVIFCKNNPDSPQAKAFTETWKQLHVLFPTLYRPIERFDEAFKTAVTLKDLFTSTKAQYYILHAFANYNEFSKESDKKRALTLIYNNEHATVADLRAILEIRDDMDEKIATAIVEKCKQKIEFLQKIPSGLRDNRMSGNKTFDTKYSYKIKSICLDGRDAARMLLGPRAKYAIEMMTFFKQILDKLTEESAERAKAPEMPDINDLSKYPNYASVLQAVKAEEKIVKR